MHLLGQCANRCTCAYWGQCVLIGAYVLLGLVCANRYICTYLVSMC